MKKLWIMIILAICTILGMKTNKVKAESWQDGNYTITIDDSIVTGGDIISKYGSGLNKDTTSEGYTWSQITQMYNLITIYTERNSTKGYIRAYNIGSDTVIKFGEQDNTYLISVENENNNTIFGNRITIDANGNLGIGENLGLSIGAGLRRNTNTVFLNVPSYTRIYIGDEKIHGFNPSQYNGLGNFIYQDFDAFGQYDPDDKIGDPLKRYVLDCDYPIGESVNVEWYMYIPKKDKWDLFQRWYNEGTMWNMIEKLTIPTHELEKTSTGENVYWWPIEQGMENYFNSFDWCVHTIYMTVEEHYDTLRDEDYNATGTRKRNALVFDWDDVMLQIFNEENIDIGYSWDNYDYEVMVAMLYYSFPKSARVIETNQERTYNRRTSAYEWEEILKETTAELPEGWYDSSINQYYIDAYRTTDENFKNQLDDNTWFIVKSWEAIPTPLRDLIIVMLCAGIIAGFIKLVM